jgi:hypothetical protein
VDGYFPKLPNGQDQFMLVSFTGGRVSAYILNFYPAKSEQEAKMAVLAELPRDAVLVSDSLDGNVLPKCHQEYFTSQTLKQAGDELGVLAELQSGTADTTPYDAISVTSATFSVNYYSLANPVPC